MVLIAHKLDDIDITRVGIVPRCGQPGRYKYWVMVKTGWKRGSGRVGGQPIPLPSRAGLQGVGRSDVNLEAGSPDLESFWRAEVDLHAPSFQPSGISPSMELCARKAQNGMGLQH